MTGISSGAPSESGASFSLRQLHESVVLAEEIDALGHLNVRFYARRALESTDRLISMLGLDADVFRASSALAYDLPTLFTRYQREQHTGAKLSVYGGLLEILPRGLRIYHELRNPERDELAASFVHDVAFRAPGEAASLPIPENVRKALAPFRISFPLRGRPRTIDLDRAPVAPSLEEVLEGGLAFRLPREIETENCDAEGRLTAEMRPFYMWGGDPIPPALPSDGPSLIPLPDGAKMGWASMEARSVMLEQPMSGMRIQSFAATVELARKTNLRRYWVFDLDTGRLLLANEVVELALHLGERRAIEIPEEIRQEMESSLRTDLR